MNFILSEEDVAFNRSLDPREVLRQMGFAGDAIDDEGERIRLFCPIHKDQIRRSLLIEKSVNRFQCTYKACPANKGGHLIELLAMYLGVDVPQAIEHLRGAPVPEEGLAARADRLIESGDVAGALRLFEEAVRLSPRDEVTRCKLAAAYLEMGRRDDGFREYLVAAEDFAVKNQVDKTLTIYNILVMLSPQDVRVRRQMAYLFSRLGRHKDAAEQLKWVVDRLMSRGEIPEALKCARQVLDLCPEAPEIHMFMAKLLSQSHKIGEAVAAAEQAAHLAYDQGEMKLADEAVTFGLIYNPQHEGLRAMEAHLRATTPAGAPLEEPAAGDDDFGDWLGSLEQAIVSDKPITGIVREGAVAAEPVPGRSAKDSQIRQQEWMDFCRGTLEGLDDDKLQSMGQHLRQMFADVQSTFQMGDVDEWELNVLKDFYMSFCRAYDEVRKG